VLFDRPGPLSARHELNEFSCGEAVLDAWLKTSSLKNLAAGASRTYVICPKTEHKVIGYFSLNMGQILSADVTGSMRRNMPHQIPAIMLGRLAIDTQWQGQGLGRALLADVIRRATLASKEVAARLVIVHALTSNAQKFYEHHGFTRLPGEVAFLAFDLVKFETTEKTA
jgi:GNAT superfamily N-acetyltransferase